MVTFLFWNLKRLRRTEVLARLVERHDVDVIILAELATADEELLPTLSRESASAFHRPWCLPGHVDVFTRLASGAMQPVFDDPAGRLTIRRLVLETQDILVAAVHFQSKVNWSDDDQQEESRNLARHIADTEDQFGHRRTVLLGDLNMNPFDKGVVSSHSLHGVMTRNIVRKESRTVAGHEYPFFYNPMWGCFGDRTAGPPGTHFFSAARPIMYFWNMYDQVLIRPALLDAFRDELRILDSDGTVSLVTDDGRPDASIGSDHLPLVFRLHL